jgi:hypothetical protein
MNTHDRMLPSGTEAKVEYLDGDYRMLRYGTFVRCGVTGQAIPIDDLRYWSVERQEAYATPAAIMQRLAEEK